MHCALLRGCGASEGMVDPTAPHIFKAPQPLRRWCSGLALHAAAAEAVYRLPEHGYEHAEANLCRPSAVAFRVNPNCYM